MIPVTSTLIITFCSRMILVCSVLMIPVNYYYINDTSDTNDTSDQYIYNILWQNDISCSVLTIPVNYYINDTSYQYIHDFILHCVYDISLYYIDDVNKIVPNSISNINIVKFKATYGSMLYPNTDIPSSCILVIPMMTAPACFSLQAMVQSWMTGILPMKEVPHLAWYGAWKVLIRICMKIMNMHVSSHQVFRQCPDYLQGGLT